jgi:hypothetical protein
LMAPLASLQRSAPAPSTACRTINSMPAPGVCDEIIATPVLRQDDCTAACQQPRRFRRTKG